MTKNLLYWFLRYLVLLTNPYTLEFNENKRRLDLNNLRTLIYHFNEYDPD